MSKKIGPRTYKLMWDAHSLSGIVIGLALFVIFFTGTLLLFRGEMRAWEEPALRNQAGEPASVEALTRPVLDSLSGDEPPSYLYMNVPNTQHDQLRMYMSGGNLEAPLDAWVNPVSGDWVTNPDQGLVTHTLYYLHFLYQMGQFGLYLSGFVALFGLLSVVTGVVVHFDRIVDDFYQFRPAKQLRVAWADAHKVLGTIGLPFQTMYVLTGAYFGLAGLLALLYSGLLLDGNATEFYRNAGYYGPSATADSVAKVADAPPTFDRLAAKTAAPWTDFGVETIIGYGVGTPSAKVEVVGRPEHTVFGGTGSATFHGKTGEELARRAPEEAGALNEVVQSMQILHFGEFGGVALKWLFFLLGLASCAVILTGNLTWLEARRRQDRWIEDVLERLTAGVATGMLPATALMFVADRWVLQGMADPIFWTNLCFFGSWGLATVYGLLRKNVARTHRSLLLAGGVLALLIPVANGTTTGDWPWVAWELGRWAVLGVDLTAAALGASALGIASLLDVEAAEQVEVPSENGRPSVPEEKLPRPEDVARAES